MATNDYIVNIKNGVEAYRKAEWEKQTLYRMRTAGEDASRIEKQESYVIMALCDIEQSFDKDALEASVGSANYRCSARTISAEDILKALAEIEKKLNISKKAMDGISVTVDLHAQDFPHAYKGRPESTQFRAFFKNGSWRVANIWRGDTKRASQRVTVDLTEAAKEAIISKFEVWA